MPIKQTRPRKGSAPMVYFKGTRTGLRKVLPGTLQKKLEKTGVSFHSQSEAFEFLEHAISVAETLWKNRAKLTTIFTKQGAIPVRIVKTRSGRILIHQMPQTHGMTSSGSEYAFTNLQKVLLSNFRGQSTPNSVLRSGRTRLSYWMIPSILNETTHGDSYSLEINAPLRQHTSRDSVYGYKPRSLEEGNRYIQAAQSNQIVSVNILIDKNATAKAKKAKKEFYKKEIQEKFKVPLKFVEAEK